MTPPTATSHNGSVTIRRSTTPKSELWQRIRAARAHAELTQSEVAKALGLTRPAISLWESKEALNRTRPTSEQMNQLALLCKVSPGWLVDDTSDPMKVVPYDATEMADEVIPMSVEKARAGAFWNAVRYNILAEHPKLSAAFEHRLPGTSLVVPFHAGRAVVSFTYDEGGRGAKGQEDLLYDEAAKLLLYELMLGVRCTKMVAVWTRTGRYDSAAVKELSRRGVTVCSFNEIDKAVAALVSAAGS